MEILMQVISWVLFGFISFKVAEKLNGEYGTNFNPGIWAAIGVLFGLIGWAILGFYAFFKIKQ